MRGYKIESQRKISFFIFIILIINFLTFAVNSHCQVSVPGKPESFSLSQKKNLILPGKILGKIDFEELLKEDSDNGITNRYSVIKELSINLRDSSLRTEIPGKGYIWQYRLKTEKAFSLGLLFTTYHLPKGASVFIFTPDHSHVLGAFTSLNNNSLSMLAIADLKTNEAIIEYYEPYFPEFPGDLVLGPVSVAYRDIMGILSEDGSTGINCPLGADWQDEKNSVCRITFRVGTASYYCSGFLVNNAGQEPIPYFMTANHCISSESSASTMVAYFNFEYSGCNSGTLEVGHTISGSTLVSGNANSDFSLLVLNSIPPKYYRAYMAGWDAGKRVPRSGVGIHHPAGTPKCIAAENNPFTYYTGKIGWDDGSITDENTHWLVRFDIGNVESGSSGSPIFDDLHRVVGQLHGGEDLDSYYGAFNASWNLNSHSKKQLKFWLDPNNTKTTSLDGKYYSALPRAEFSVPFKKVCLNNTFTLNDNTKYSPGKWKWTILPSTFVFINGTNETSQNPKVRLNESGNYTVKLVSTNEWGSDSIVKTDFITAVNEIFLSFEGIPTDNQICGCDLKGFPIKASGANEYTFSINNPGKVELIAGPETAFLSLLPDQKKYGNFTSFLRAKGSIGTCTKSDSILLNIVMPVNDDIQYALSLNTGKNGPFSNYCASGQFEEPFPKTSNCYSSSDWCPGSTSDGIRNSIWFTFIGPSDGKITIDTKGINNRISVYEADSGQQIISGFTKNYRIMGANDDRSSIDASAILENLPVIPGKKYWLQVESLDADAGNISISLINKGLEIFPNPSSGRLDMILPYGSEGLTEIYIYSNTGKMVFSEIKEITTDSNRFEINLPDSAPGIYFIRLRIAGNIFLKKILLLQ